MPYSDPANFQEVADRCAAVARRLLASLTGRGYALTDARGAALSNCARVCVGALVPLNLLARGEGKAEAGEDLEELASKIALRAQDVSEIVDKTTRLGLVVLYQFQVECLFRALARELDPKASAKSYYSLAKALVEATALPRHDFEILYVPAHLRNCLHAGGIHHGYQGASHSVTIDGFAYHFLHGQLVTCAGWGHVLHALGAAVGALERVLDSRRVRAIAQVSG